jgi:putative ATP-dependent endonuclease of OLD family
MMPMHRGDAVRIVQCTIQNFRGIQDGTITVPEHGVIFGPNNVGKSTIIEALALALGREQMTQPLSDWDFWGGDPKPHSRITIICTISHFGANAGPEGFPDWFVGEQSARAVWWDETSAQVKTDADCPKGCILAAQIALCIRFDEEFAEFECIRHFYDGPGDPFSTECRKVPNILVQELGVFVLPANRQWDKLLSFGSSSFLKVLKASGSIPGNTIDQLKAELRTLASRIEEDPALSELIATAEHELTQFQMFKDGAQLVYRPTLLDTRSVIQSLVPHVEHGGFLLPFSRHGAGMNSLQAFLIVLAFAEQRRKRHKNFILLAEEPELHLHPSLHSRLANRIRALSQQSLVTTHSPFLASSYSPRVALFVRNENGALNAAFLRNEPVANIPKSAIRSLYLRKREELYSALMGESVIIPEGETDARWLALLQRIIESRCEDGMDGALSIVPTQSASVVETFEEVSKFRRDVVPLVDGDSAGDSYTTKLIALTSPPQKIVRYASKTAIEGLGCWVVQPCLAHPGQLLTECLNGHPPTPKALFEFMCAEKNNSELLENLVWEASEESAALRRMNSFLNDLCEIAAGRLPKETGWALAKAGTSDVFTATHIVRP